MIGGVRLVVTDDDRHLDSFGGPITLIDIDLREWVVQQLGAVLDPEITKRARISIALDMPVHVKASEWVVLEPRDGP